MYEIWNFGRSRKVPSVAGFIHLTRNRGFQTDDKDLADHLAVFPSVSVTVMEVQSAQTKVGMKESAALGDMGMSELHKVAKRRGIRDTFGQTKKWLINAIRGKEEVKK